MLHIVKRPEMAPGHCMATMTHEDPEGFIDTLESPACIDPRVYISVSWVKEIARKFGFVDGAEIEALERRMADMERRLVEADEFKAAVEHTMSKFGQKVPRRRPGRPKAVNNGSK